MTSEHNVSIIIMLCGALKTYSTLLPTQQEQVSS